MRWRDLPLSTRRPYGFLRVSPASGDGYYSMAEIRAYRAEGHVIHLTGGADRRARAAGAGSRHSARSCACRRLLRRVTWSSWHDPSICSGQRLRLEHEARPLASLVMQPGLHVYVVRLAPMSCPKRCELTLRFRYATAAGGDRRTLAAWFEALFLLPAAR